MKDTLRLDTKPGDTIVFRFIHNGYDTDKMLAARYLKQGQSYTIAEFSAGSCHSWVRLKEVPGVIFNSVQFANAEGRANPKGKI